MTTIQESIVVKVPVRTAYNHLTQFEAYPLFMQDVDEVQQIDDTHLHWTARLADRSVEWDVEITEQEPDRCIAWNDNGGPANTGKLELQPLGPETSQVTLTLRTGSGQAAELSGADAEEALARKLRQDLQRLKDVVENLGGTAKGWRGEIHEGAVFSDTADAGAPAGEGPAADAASASQGAPASAVVGAHGGTDAAAGAQLSGSKGATQGRNEQRDATGAPGSPGGMVQGDRVSPAAGADAAGGTGLGSAATADDTRTGTGTSSGSGTALVGGGASGARDAGISGSGGKH